MKRVDAHVRTFAGPVSKRIGVLCKDQRGSRQIREFTIGGRHPRFLKSSRMCHVVAPGGVFVVGRVGPQAAVEDADEAVGDLTQGGLVADVAGAELLVVGTGSG
jgi:hypothetical protein